MKKNLLLLAACGGMLLAANEIKAQETIVIDENTTIDVSKVECKDVYTHDWHKNWFIQLGAGAQLPFVEDTRFTNHDWYHQITATYNVGVGHWWSPYFGFRFTGFYGPIHWDNQAWGKAKDVNLNLEVMWDMFNSICGYKDRVFSIIPFLGFGATYTWDYSGLTNLYDRHGNEKVNNWTMPISAGFQFRFRLCKYVDLFAEGRYMFYPDTWNRDAVNRPLDINAVAIAGVNVNLGGRHFESYNPCEYLDHIRNLNNQVNDLRGALATTAAALAACEAQLPCPEVPAAVEETRKPAPMLSCVRFKINSARVSNQEMVNVYNVAKWMEANPTANVKIRGYADKDTGTSNYNMKLSERRAQAVYDILVKDYHINPDRLTTEQYGSDVQPFEVNNWNRIVLFAE